MKRLKYPKNIGHTSTEQGHVPKRADRLYSYSTQNDMYDLFLTWILGPIYAFALMSVLIAIIHAVIIGIT